MKQTDPTAANLTPSSPAPAPNAGPTKTSEEVIRTQFLDKPVVCRVLPEYIAGLPEQMAHIQDCLDQRDLATLRRLVHQLRGSGGAYGFPDITELATAAEMSIDEKGPLDGVCTRVNELVNLVRRVEGYERTKEQRPGD